MQSRTVRRPEQCDAAVLALPQSPRGIAVSIDGSGRRVACDPYTGTIEAVLECTANLACAGAEPLGLTNCLNFGNPEKPHIAWQLTESIRALGDACRALDMPVVGGNVSLYNESGGGPIYPTPVVGIVGELPDVARAGRAGFARAGDAVGFAGPFRPRLAGSELAKLRGEELPLGLEPIDIAAVRAAQVAIRDAVRDGSLSSAHDVAEGGFLVAVAESCLAGGLGATLDLGPVEDAAELERDPVRRIARRGLRRLGPRGRAAPTRRARRDRPLRHRRRRRARRHERRRADHGLARRAARGASGARAAVSLAQAPRARAHVQGRALPSE